MAAGEGDAVTDFIVEVPELDDALPPGAAVALTGLDSETPVLRVGTRLFFGRFDEAPGVTVVLAREGAVAPALAAAGAAHAVVAATPRRIVFSSMPSA